MHFLCQGDASIGSDFYVVDLIGGRNFNEPMLDELKWICDIKMTDEAAAPPRDWNRVGKRIKRGRGLGQLR
tara:strand:- start:1111 stop:1323 length:213 start_codon:yes stop_codon:yes gene_type:complete